MSGKNNIEDFFNRSMDGFNEEPSAEVWDGLNARMEEEVPIWKKYLLKWMGVVGVLLLIGFGAYRSSVVSEIEMLNKEKLSLENAKLTLENELKNCTALAMRSDKVIPKESTVGAQEKEKQTQAIVENSGRASYEKNNTSNWIEKESQTKLLTTAAAKANTIYNPTQKLSPQKNINKNSNGEEFSNNLNSQKSLNSNFSILSKPLLLTSKTLPLFIAGPRIDRMESASTITIWPSRLRSTFRYGMTLGVFSTLTDLENDFDTDFEPNFDATFNLHWQLFRRLAITSGLGFNVQEYKVNLDASNQTLLDQFPNTEDITSSVSKIKVKNFYVDLPVGLKFNFGNWSKLGSSFYINPGVSWQLLLPQKFDYEGPGDLLTTVREERYFLYFGSIFLNAGIEKQIFKKSRLHLGLWAEKGLVDYGLEDRQTLNLGISGGILFGR